MALVKDYGCYTEDDVNFDVNFWIPDNCDYIVGQASGKYKIEVYLKKGQSGPSPDFIKCRVTAVASNDIMLVDFEQILNGVTSTRPKIKIENTSSGV